MREKIHFTRMCRDCLNLFNTEKRYSKYCESCLAKRCGKKKDDEKNRRIDKKEI